MRDIIPTHEKKGNILAKKIISIGLVFLMVFSMFSAPVSASTTNSISSNSAEFQVDSNQITSTPLQTTTQSTISDISWSEQGTIKIYYIDYTETDTDTGNQVGEDVIDTDNYDTGDGGWERIKYANSQGGAYYPDYIDSVTRRYVFTVKDSSGVDLGQTTGPDVDDAVELRAGVWDTNTEQYVNSWSQEFFNPVKGTAAADNLRISVEEINRFDRASAVDARVLGDDDPGLFVDDDNDDAIVDYSETTYVLGINRLETYSFSLSDEKAQSISGDATLSFNFVGVASQRGAGDGKKLSINVNDNEIFSGFNSYAAGQRTVQFPSSYLTEGENEVTVSGPSISGAGAYGFTISDLSVNAQTNPDFDNDGVKNWNDDKPRTPEDNDGYQDNDGVPENPAPSVSIGDTSVNGGDSTRLTANANDPEGESLNYDWSLSGQGDIQGSGSSVTYNAPDLLSSDTSTDISVTVFEEDEDKSADSSATIDISANDPDGDGIPNDEDGAPNKPEDKDGYQDNDGVPENPAPSVSISDTAVSEDRSTTITASATDPEGESLDYKWSSPNEGTIRGSGSSVTYEAPSSISSDTSTRVEVTVYENDEQKSAADTATVDITDNNKPPTAEANGPYTVTEGGSVQLDSSGSTDSDGNIASKSWSVTSGPGVISGSEYQAPTDISQDREATVKLTVTDDDNNPSTDTTTVDITDNNKPPTAEANGPYTVTEGGSVQLDSSGSTDSDGNVASTSWSIASGSGSISGSEYQAPADISQDSEATIKLTVKDDDGQPATDTATISISKQPNPANFDVSIQSTNAPITAGETLEVTVSVKNTGDKSATNNVELNIPNVARDSKSLTLSGGESRDVTLSVSTVTGDTGTKTIEVSTPNDSTTQEVTINEQTNPSEFTIDSVDLNSPVEGNDIVLDVIVSNIGEEDGTASITAGFAGLGTDSKSVQISGGSSTETTLSIPTNDDDAGSYSGEISTTDDSKSISTKIGEQSNSADPITQEEVAITGSTISIKTGGSAAISISDLPSDISVTDVSDGGTYNPTTNEILYTDFGGELPDTVTFKLTPENGYTAGDTISFTADEKTVTLDVVAAKIPQELSGDVTAEQYNAVVDGDKLSASDLAAAINGWSANGQVNGVDIGAIELSKLINYWANS